MCFFLHARCGVVTSTQRLTVHAKESLIKKFGPNYSAEIAKRLEAYYRVLNHLCALHELEKMYIPPLVDARVGISANQTLWESQFLFEDLNVLKPATAAEQPAVPRLARVLDIGCGRGRVAAHMATLGAGQVSVFGINVDRDQLASAEANRTRRGLQGVLAFERGDVNAVPLAFGDEHFDAIYHVQVFSYSKDLEALMRDIYRMLKPGGRFVCLDWVLEPAFDPNDAHHQDLLKRIKPLIGAIGCPTVARYENAIKGAGMQLLKSLDVSIDANQAPLIRMASVAFVKAESRVRALRRLHLVSKQVPALLERFNLDGEAFIEAVDKKLVTSSWYFVAQKPLVSAVQEI